MPSVIFWLFCVVAGFGVSKVSFNEVMSLGSSISILFFSLPALYAMKMWLGLSRAFLLFIILSILAYSFEASSILTGFPYGLFSYGNGLAYKFFEIVPWNVPFAWIPAVVGSVAVVRSRFSLVWQQVLVTSGMLLLYDLLLDPAAVALHFWTWHSPGAYYQVPYTNFLGWIFTGAIGSAVVLWFGKKLGALPRVSQVGFMGITLFWVAAAASLSLIVPTVFGLVLVVLLFRSGIKVSAEEGDKL